MPFPVSHSQSRFSLIGVDWRDIINLELYLVHKLVTNRGSPIDTTREIIVEAAGEAARKISDALPDENDWHSFMTALKLIAGILLIVFLMFIYFRFF